MCRSFSASVLNVWQALLTPEVSYSGIRFGNNMSSMGARVTRMFRNFNLENRAHREISKEKPLAAPRHSVNIVPAPSTEVTEITEDIHKRNDPLLSLLKSVYVESNDPTTEEPKQVTEGTNAGRRKLKFSLPGSPYGIVEITDVPKGKLSIVEALTVLNHHKQEPQRWTPDKIAQEYCLDPKDSQALLQFFIPFEVKIIPPKTKDTKQIKDN